MAVPPLSTLATTAPTTLWRKTKLVKDLNAHVKSTAAHRQTWAPRRLATTNVVSGGRRADVAITTIRHEGTVLCERLYSWKRQSGESRKMIAKETTVFGVVQISKNKIAIGR